MRVMDAVEETITDEGLTLETSAIVSFTASITKINTQCDMNMKEGDMKGVFAHCRPLPS